ncbi:MAG: Ig-like domain-containing protein [Oscillospiraceae bacterium]|nr:Ig-like domain-containing protein [Oscillospiraceae bacterium]
MKKLSKFLAVLLAVTFVFSLAAIFASASAGKMPNPKYSRPQKGIPQFTASQKKPVMDGVFSLDEWGNNTKLFSFNMDMINAGEGHVWLNLAQNLEDPQNPVPVNGDFHMAWDPETIYMALVMRGVKHFQQQDNAEFLWKEDCLIIQIGADTNGQAERFEYGFTYSVGFGKPLGFRWYPTQATIQAPDREPDRWFFTSRDNITQETVYEMRLRRTTFGRNRVLAAGDVIPFAAALHVYDPNDWYNPEFDDGGPGSGPRGCFYEWGEGVIGGTEEMTLDDAAWIRLMASPVSGPIVDHQAIEITTKPIVLETGKSFQLLTTGLYSGSKEWTSNNKYVAAVTSDGIVTGLKPGTAVITVTLSIDGNTFQDTCSVTVKYGLGQVSGGDTLVIGDARLVLQYLVGKGALSPEQLDAANVSGGPEVSITDARYILQKLVGKIEAFPRTDYL